MEETTGLDEKSHQLLLSYAVKKMFSESVDVKGFTLSIDPNHATRSFVHALVTLGFKFYQSWSKFALSMKKEDSPKVYVVVADIQDAFGSIILSKLIDVLCELSKKLPHKMFIHEFRRR